MFRTLFLDADDTVFDFGAAQRAALEESFRTLGYPFNEEIYGIYDGINIKNGKRISVKSREICVLAGRSERRSEIFVREI